MKSVQAQPTNQRFVCCASAIDPKRNIMNRLFSILLILTFASGSLTPASSAPQSIHNGPVDTVKINDTACWGTTPTGPDFQGVKCLPFQARNPTRAVWEASQAAVR